MHVSWLQHVLRNSLPFSFILPRPVSSKQFLRGRFFVGNLFNIEQNNTNVLFKVLQLNYWIKIWKFDISFEHRQICYAKHLLAPSSMARNHLCFPCIIYTKKGFCLLNPKVILFVITGNPGNPKVIPLFFKSKNLKTAIL